MDYSAGSFFSSWPSNSASENYSFVDGSVESYAGEGSMPPTGFFRATSDHNLNFDEHEKNTTILTNECLQYNTQTGLLPGENLSEDKPSNNLVELQQHQNNGSLQSNLMTPRVLQCNSMPGTFDPQLDTPGLLELPHALSSSIESNDSEISAFLADVQAVSSASTLCSTYQNVPSYMEPVSLEAFSFQRAQNAAMFNTSCSNGNLSVFDKATMASLHDNKEFANGSISSFATAQQPHLATGGLKAEQQEQYTMCNIPLPSFVSGSSVAVTEPQEALIPPKITSMIHNNKSEHSVPISRSSDAQHQANSAHGNSASAEATCKGSRRGQATDPHSIAERLRREKISERMKNLQDLVPNSNKADKSSMLDEIIDYVKFLQLQVKVLSMSRLGAPGAVLPLLADSQTEGRSNSPPSDQTISQGLLDVADPEDSLVFEQEVIKLMETSITSAMQYLQNKGLCLMPIALASAITHQKGMSGAAVPPPKR